MDADHQKSAFASKRGVPKCPFGELYVLHFQTDDFFKTKFCGKQEDKEILKTSDFLKIIVSYHAFILVKVLIVNPLYAIYLCLCFLSLTL